MTNITALAKTHNISIIGSTGEPSYKGSSYLHASTLRDRVIQIFFNSEYFKGLLHEERTMGSYALTSTITNTEYYEVGYQLFLTCRGDYIFAPKHHNMPIILYTQKEYNLVKPEAPRVMQCTEASCDYGTIEHNGSCYPCGTCLDISDYKKALNIYNKRIAQSV